jgi:hypothetical protein
MVDYVADLDTVWEHLLFFESRQHSFAHALRCREDVHAIRRISFEKAYKYYFAGFT